MTDQQLQEAIDKTRAWLLSTSFPTIKCRDDAVAALAELQKIQVVRASLPSFPLMSMPTDEDYLAAMGPCGK